MITANHYTLLQRGKYMLQCAAGLFDNLIGILSLGYLSSNFEMTVLVWSVIPKDKR